MPKMIALSIIMLWEKIKPISAQMGKDFQRTKGLELLVNPYDEVKKQQQL